MVKMLFEIGYEEFPPSFVEPTADFLSTSIEKMLDAERLACHDVVAYSTSSRIAILLDGLPDGQPDLKEKVTGAPKRIALGEDGKLTKAGEAFVRKNGLSDYFFEDSKKGEVIAGWKEAKGRTLEEIITGIIDVVLLKILFKKSMRWGSNEFVFARPIRWILLMLNETPVEHTFQNIAFSKTSFGHRFLAPEGVTVDFDTYKTVMKEKNVIVDREKRAEIIKESIVLTAERVLAPPLYDEKMLNKVVNSTEFPVCVIGKIPQEFMHLPAELIIKVLASDQQYFTFRRADGILQSRFIATLNNKPVDKNLVIRGCEKVVSARLADAAFYYDEDLKTPFDSYTEKLSEMLFHRNLGSYLDRANRVKAVALFIAEQWFELSEREVASLEKAALMAKNDLLTGVVYEFPDLQGVMGSYYAAHSGESNCVAATMKEHYQPKWLGDAFPTTTVSTIVAIADKIETIVGGFMAGMKPTGSKDKFAIRRNALTLLSLLIDTEKTVDLERIILFASDRINQFNSDLSLDSEELFRFIAQRYSAVLDLDTSVVQTAVSGGWKTPIEVAERAAAIEAVKERDDIVQLAALFKRAGNIVKKFDGRLVGECDTSLFSLPAEKELHECIVSVRSEIELIEEKIALVEKITAIKPVLDTFFDVVMVMDEDEKIRNNRLLLLDSVITLVKNNIGDMNHLNL